MNKKIVSMVLLLLLLVAGFGAIVTVYAQYTPVDVRTPYNFIYEGIGDPDTVDPAWACDTASQGLISNVYDTLIQEFAYSKLALVVGVADYADGDNLDYPDDDALYVADYLRVRGWTVTTLINEQATAVNIISNLINLKSVSESDHVLFFFAGHGIQLPDQPEGDPQKDELDHLDEYLCAYDGANIGDDFLTMWVREVPSSNLAIILDSCHSGGFIRIIDAHTFGGKQLQARDGAIVLTAAGGINGNADPIERDKELSYDHPGHQHGEFTYHLFLEGLVSTTSLEPAFTTADNNMRTCPDFDQVPLMNDRYFGGNYDLAASWDERSVLGLAEYWLILGPHPSAPAGTVYTWYFEIRTGVKFHDGSTLTTEDVEYSFERAMVQDRSGGPVWMINEPLFGDGWPDKSGWPETAGNPIDTAVESNSTHVWFNLAMLYPKFMQTLSQSWASIVNKQWCANQGDWPGAWSNWKSYADPVVSPLDVAGDMMGTGPYMLDYWDHGVEYSIVAFNKDITWPGGYDPAGPNPPHTYEYWQGWPAENAANYLKRATVKVNYEWGVRRANFLAGLADTVYVPTAYLPQMIENWPTTWNADARMRLDAEGTPEYYKTGIRCLPGIPIPGMDALLFNLYIPAASPYVGTGSFPNGIPLDFFSDDRIWMAFAYSFNYNEFIADMFWGEAVQLIMYRYDPYMAAWLFQTASADSNSPAYQVWDLGFTMTIIYNTGNVLRETAAMMLKYNIESLFELGPDGIASTGDEAPGTATINVQPVPWPTYLGELVSGILPIFIYGWLADFPQPPWEYRYAIVPLIQPFGRYCERDWVQGWCYNPLFRASSTDTIDPFFTRGLYFYYLWKGLNGDINKGSAADGKVDILDLGEISGHWYPGPPVGTQGYDRIADIYPELQYNDIPKVEESPGVWIPHPSIGAVDIYDAALVSAHWLEQINPI